MKILHVIGTLNRAGAETWLTQILHNIDRQKYGMHYLVHTADPGDYDEEITALGSRVIRCLPRLKHGNPLQYALNFRRILREYGPYDCVHSHIHHTSGFILMLAAIMRIPVRIAHSHCDTRTLDRKSPFLIRMYYATMNVLIRCFATQGIAVSKNAGPSLFSASWASDPRWQVCGLGIDLHPFGEEIDSGRLRAELGIPGDSFVIGHVGRIDNQKNHRFIVDIAEHFCRMEPRAVFLLVGDGSLTSEIENRVRNLGLGDHFIFAGVRRDVPRLMKGAMDCFLFPSLFEGLGLVLLEAQAAGLTCVISDKLPDEASVIPELVRRISLEEPAEVWAGELLRIRSLPRQPRADTLSRMLDCSIEASVSRLTQIYDSASSMGEAATGNRSTVAAASSKV
jgi:glycosyltransferase involved in cell wall biosynthesis